MAVANEMVGRSLPLGIGVPHAEQKRTLFGNSVAQDEHLAMIFPATVYSRLRISDLPALGHVKSDIRRLRSGLLPSKR